MKPPVKIWWLLNIIKILNKQIITNIHGNKNIKHELNEKENSKTTIKEYYNSFRYWLKNLIMLL